MTTDYLSRFLMNFLQIKINFVIHGAPILQIQFYVEWKMKEEARIMVNQMYFTICTQKWLSAH